MLYEMLTGHVPFSGESTGEILMKHLTEAPDLAKIPAQFRSVVGRALEKDPQRRTPGAGQLLDEFRRARRGEPVAEDIPASHFVDVPRLERMASLKSDPPAPGQRPLNGNAATAHYPGQNYAASPPFARPKATGPAAVSRPPPRRAPGGDGMGAIRRGSRPETVAAAGGDCVRRCARIFHLGIRGTDASLAMVVALAGACYVTLVAVKFAGRPNRAPDVSRNPGRAGFAAPCPPRRRTPGRDRLGAVRRANPPETVARGRNCFRHRAGVSQVGVWRRCGARSDGSIGPRGGLLRHAGRPQVGGPRESFARHLKGCRCSRCASVLGACGCPTTCRLTGRPAHPRGSSLRAAAEIPIADARHAP